MARRSLSGCRTVLTGASSGIGRALALELGSRGAQIVAVARRAEKLAELAAEFAARTAASHLDARPGQLETLVGDITDPSTQNRALERAVACWGGLDLLINNAGVGSRGRFADSSAEVLRRVMEVNFFAAAELIRLALPHLAQGRRPLIVNMGSILGHRAIPFASEYCAAKFALRGLSEALRTELARRSIELLVVSPGATQTEFSANVLGGGTYPWREISSVSAQTVARTTVRAIERSKREVFVNWRGRLLVWLNQIAPGCIDRILARYG